jgi:2-polyprenyl-3-methyl-5-hydroxy-6-metoxy-1,4-benzoquinol methylase
LDVGCGGGAFVYAARQQGWDAYGCDLSAPAVEHARSFWSLDGLVHCVDLDDVEMDEKFDVVTAFHLLEHSYSPEDLLRRFRSILLDDGLLVIAGPNFGSKDVSEDAEVFERVAGLPYHVTHFTPSTLRALLQKAGYRIIGWQMFPSAWLMGQFRWNHVSDKNQEVSARIDDPTALVVPHPTLQVVKGHIVNMLGRLSPGPYMVAYCK